MEIFEANAAPTKACHASTIAECEGRLVAAWFGGDHEKHPNVSIWSAARDGGAGWSVPREIADGRQPGGASVACWNPVLFKVPGGPLLLFYKVGAEISAWRTFMKSSDDCGATWSVARDLGDGIVGPVKNKPVMLGQTMVCPSSAEPTWRQWQAYMSLTADLGRTWHLVGPLNDPARLQAIQPTLLTQGGGRLQALCRTRSGAVATMWSDDGGLAWSPMTLTALPNPNSGIDAVTLQDGRHLLVYNHSTKGRSPLNVAISTDGVEWEPFTVLESDPGEYSYPAVIQGGDGRVHVTYTSNRETIRYEEIRQLAASD